MVTNSRIRRDLVEALTTYPYLSGLTISLKSLDSTTTTLDYQFDVLSCWIIKIEVQKNDNPQVSFRKIPLYLELFFNKVRKNIVVSSKINIITRTILLYLQL